MKILTVLLVIAGGCYVGAHPPDASTWDHRLHKRAGNCASPQFVYPNIAGDTTAGGPFCESSWGRKYSPITNITVWSQAFSINGMQVTYADGSRSALYGTKNTQFVSSIGLDYAKGERWTSWIGYWESYTCDSDHFCSHNPNLNAIHIAASNGQIIQASEQPYYLDHNHAPATNQDVGSGILFGLKGTNDSQDINSVTALFLDSGIKRIQISKFKFPKGPTGSQNIHIDSLDNAHFYNGQKSGNTSWIFSSSEALMTTNTFTQATTETYGKTENIGISVSIPVVGITLGGSSMTSFMWSKAYMQSSTSTIAKTVTVSWSESGTLSPKTGVDARALVGQGVGTFPYTCSVKITLANGSSFTFKENGHLTINDVSNAVVTVRTNNHPA